MLVIPRERKSSDGGMVQAGAPPGHCRDQHLETKSSSALVFTRAIKHYTRGDGKVSSRGRSAHHGRLKKLLLDSLTTFLLLLHLLLSFHDLLQRVPSRRSKQGIVQLPIALCRMQGGTARGSFVNLLAYQVSTRSLG